MKDTVVSFLNSINSNDCAAILKLNGSSRAKA